MLTGVPFYIGELLIMMKACTRCKFPTPLYEFSLSKNHKDGHLYVCKRCDKRRVTKSYNENKEKRLSKMKEWRDNHIDQHRSSAREWCRNNPEKVKINKLWNRYKLRPTDYQSLIDSQGNKCKICLIDFSYDNKNLIPHVDHDHKCCSNGNSCGKCVRGLLCGKCNTIIGVANDNVNILKSSIEYLTGGV